MATKHALKGKLDVEQMGDFDTLILRLRNANLCNYENGKCKKRLSLFEIRPLSGDDNSRLWTYIRHCCKLAAMTKDSQDKIKRLCLVDPRLEMEDLVADAVNDMSLHVYRYVWRDYVHSEEPGYVMSTAFLGFKSWREKMVEKMTFEGLAKGLADSFKRELLSDKKLVNVNEK